MALRRQDWVSVLVELLVVVLGVLFALQLDNWNEARRDRGLEQIYLVRLDADIQDDIEGFQNLRDIFQAKFEFLEELKSGTADEPLRRDPTAWVERLRTSLFISLPSVRSATFDELAGSGQLAIIRDLDLRSPLADYYAEYALMSRILAQPVGGYKRLVYESFPGALLYAWRTSRSISTADDVVQGYDTLIASPEFGAAVNSEAAYAGDLVLYCDQFIRRGEELRVLIGQSLR